MWWPVYIAGLLCLCGGIALAVALRPPRFHGRVRPLAHVNRLTRLPEYARAVRAQLWSTVVIILLLVGMFLAALVAGSRPLGASSRASEPDDIMLCVGAPVTDPATAGLLNYFARQSLSFDTQRIGLTSPSLRVVPLTRDYRYASDSFLRYARLADLQRHGPLPPPQATELKTRVSEFTRPLDYVDYARGVEDVLALCMAGFPGEKSERRRSLIYLGDSSIRDADEKRSALFNAAQATQMAQAAGIQVNVLARSDASTAAADLGSIAAATGGTFDVYDPAGSTADLAGSTNPTLSAALDRIRAHPPEVVGAEQTTLSDTPRLALIVAAALAVLLCMSLAVLRR
jgi:hypothetical protein